MGKRIVTMRDVAKSAGVSVATASRVLGGRGYFSVESAARVRAAAEKLGYRVHGIAQSLKRQHSNTIGLIITDIVNPFYALLSEGVLTRANELGYKIVVSVTNEDSKTEGDYLQVLMEERVAGILAVPSSGGLGGWREVIDFGTPVVFMDRELAPDLQADLIVVDNEGGAYAATKYLIELGHRRIGFITGPSALTTGEKRMNGYLRAHSAAGIPVDESLLQAVSFKGTSGYEATKRLLSNREIPTAIFAANNVLGEAALFVAKELDLVIGKKLSFLMFDDVPWARLAAPTITVVRQPAFDMGYQAMDILHERFSFQRSNEEFEPQRRVLPTELIVRESCSRPEEVRQAQA